MLLEACGFEVLNYQMDETPLDFAEKKIEAHYKKDSKRGYIVALLPLAQFLARIFKRSNKMIVYARKRQEVSVRA